MTTFRRGPRRAEGRGHVVTRWAPALVLIAAGLTACAGMSLGGPYQQYDIQFEGVVAPALATNPSDEELINTVAWLIRHQLELPFPAAIKAYVYVNQATMVDGLMAVAGESRDEAWDKGRFAAGVAARSGLFLRGDYLARMHYTARAGLIAHELAHVSQMQLREGGRGRAAQWILEGHADWVKMRVLDLMRYRPYAESRDHVVRTVVTSSTPLALFPPLQDLDGNPAWVAATNKLGAPATYCQAFLAIDWLVERYGSAKVTEFLGRFSRNENPREHWSDVFPIPYRQFVDEFRGRLANLGESTPAAAGGNLSASQPSCG
jgi:hypothetical protein